ncbi:FG-GAP repeat-containing protein [Noviherbaspirillum humi]|uniref:FG-GAP repeat-containing protein n=1 Tax=Noviherbaspirillum humi TaxID=1688639 RepID=A0A239EYB8_9BURK|nr:FG-GAP repeat protein [Noviherbaspirillum humi]SNS49441.1 FG-GAP repeat-containing protein [Noviherbaspirillum humi]
MRLQRFANHWIKHVCLGICAIALTALAACGGGGGGESAGSVASALPPAEAPAPTLTLGMKEVCLSWAAVSGATAYQLLESADGISPFAPVGDPFTGTSVNHPIALYQRVNARYKVKACNAAGCTESAVKPLSGSLAEAVGYFKASNTNGGASFGSSIALSSDGATLAVGSPFENSSATGVNGDQADAGAVNSGAVYVFTKANGEWRQQAYVKASNTGTSDYFGTTVALSADGSTLAVGAYQESSAAAGINGDQASNSAFSSGAVYVFSRSGNTWSQQAYVKASNAETGDGFGISVSLSGDGNTLAVGALDEDSAATGINGDQSSNGASGSGAVYVFGRSGNAWSQQAYIKASNSEAGDAFGRSVALSADGNTLAVGADFEDSAATGINGDQLDNSAASSGAAYVFIRSGNSWSQQAYLKASNTGANARFGISLALSADGDTLAAGAFSEGSAATGIDGDQNSNGAPNSGAVYVFIRSGGVWSQQAYVKASNTGAGENFGYAISISGDGNTLAVGAEGERSAAIGLNGNQADDTLGNNGAVYVYTRKGATWTQQAYIKPSASSANNFFGTPPALSGDGKTLAVGASGDGSDASGIGGARNSNAPFSGAVYLY